jgi:hypothetical protein
MAIIDLGWRGKALRDCPNIILPTLAAPTGILIGATPWAWPAAYNQVIPATGAGSIAYPFLVDSLILNTALTAIQTGAGLLQASFLFQYSLGKGPVAETEIAQAFDNVGFLFNVTNPAADATTTLVELAGRDKPIGPVAIPANTRLAFRGAANFTSTATLYQAGAVYLSGYDLTKLGFAPKVGYDELYEYGSHPTFSKPLVLLGTVATVSGGAWAQGAYVDVLDGLTPGTATLDDDYLILGAHGISTDATNIRQTQFDVSLGANGNEVVQARFAIAFRANFNVYSFSGAKHWRLPFIGYKGERLSVRSAAATTASRNHIVNVYGVRLS